MRSQSGQPGRAIDLASRRADIGEADQRGDGVYCAAEGDDTKSRLVVWSKKASGILLHYLRNESRPKLLPRLVCPSTDGSFTSGNGGGATLFDRVGAGASHFQYGDPRNTGRFLPVIRRYGADPCRGGAAPRIEEKIDRPAREPRGEYRKIDRRVEGTLPNIAG